VQKVRQRVEPTRREAVDRITRGDLVAFERASHLRHNQAPSRELLPESYRARHTLRDTGQALDLTTPTRRPRRPQRPIGLRTHPGRTWSLTRDARSS
jgi:hypothetical protein